MQSTLKIGQSTRGRSLFSSFLEVEEVDDHLQGYLHTQRFLKMTKYGTMCEHNVFENIVDLDRPHFPLRQNHGKTLKSNLNSIS